MIFAHFSSPGKQKSYFLESYCSVALLSSPFFQLVKKSFELRANKRQFSYYYQHPPKVNTIQAWKISRELITMNSKQVASFHLQSWKLNHVRAFLMCSFENIVHIGMGQFQVKCFRGRIVECIFSNENIFLMGVSLLRSSQLFLEGKYFQKTSVESNYVPA